MRFISTLLIASTLLGFTPQKAEAASGCSLASHYGIGDGYHGQPTANGEIYNADKKQLRGDTRTEAYGKKGIKYLRGKLAPGYATGLDFATKTEIGRAHV